MAAALRFRPSAGCSASTPAAAAISRKPASVNGGSCKICRCSMESGVSLRAWVAMKESRSGSRSMWFHTDVGANGNGFSVAAKSFEGGSESGDDLEEKSTVRLNRRQRSSGLSGGNVAAVAGLLLGNPDLLTIPGVGLRNLKKLVEKGIGGVVELKQIYKDKQNIPIHFMVHQFDQKPDFKRIYFSSDYTHATRIGEKTLVTCSLRARMLLKLLAHQKM